MTSAYFILYVSGTLVPTVFPKRRASRAMKIGAEINDRNMIEREIRKRPTAVHYTHRHPRMYFSTWYISYSLKGFIGDFVEFGSWNIMKEKMTSQKFHNIITRQANTALRFTLKK